ncbi:hypothetical protein [Paenibacillus flagellatus]|uniref:ABC transporter substrate-binding protein n=1 Tax=Paenibacillus flagellatus TaxID=2211139 RepID=A0A2V5JZZ6_9BACL|nr:hypothetical protein [Paenibacillus flagellatus]PYI52469.1 hypothetical protein DLM86_20010 [Paenibacillus flagellatus]
MWEKKKLNLLTAVLLTGSLLVTACSKSDTGTETAQNPPPATPAARTPFTFTMNTDNPNMNWTSDVAKEITKRTGATIKWDIITGDFRTKMNVWLAAGDFPEVVNIHDNTLQSYIQAKAVLDLTQLIKDHAPNIMKAYNNDLSLLQHTDGKIYGLLQPPTKKVNNLTQRGWIAIQSAVLKDAGYPAIKTLDDVRNVAANYMKKYPEIGGGKTIGFSNYGAANQLFNIFDTAARLYAGFANTSSFVIDDQLNARLRFFEPGYTDFFKFLNKINGEGLFDPESLVQTQEQFATKCNQGRVLVIFGGGGDCNGSLEKNNMADRSYVWFDIVAPGRTKYVVKPSLEANRGGEMWLSITKNAKDPVRIIQFYDDMFKLENQILVGWGFEGKYYTVENGKRVVTDWLVDQYKNHPDTFWEDVGLGYARQMSANYGAGFTLSDGDFAMWQFSESWIAKTTSPVVVETLSKYGAKTQADLLVKGIEKDYGKTAGKGTDEMKKFNTEAIAEWGKTLPKFIFEKDPSKLDSVWQGLEKTLKDKGMDKINQAATEIYQNAAKEAKK